MNAALATADRASNVLAFTPAAAQFAALPSAGLTDDGPEHDPLFARASTEAKQKFYVKRAAMEALHRSGNKTGFAKVLAAQLASSGRGFSAKRLLNDYYAWSGAAQDWRMLMDAALAPEFKRLKKSVGACEPMTGDGAALPRETAEWWIQLAEDSQRNSFAAFREAKRLWRESWSDPDVRIPGYGSARDYWSRVNPFLLASETCPPELPRGWGQSTFYAKMPLEWEMAHARVGKAYADSLLPGIPATRKGARYLEWVFFDDKWHDFFVIVDGVLTPCRLLELGALDYATGEYIVWGFRPELPAVDGEGRLRLKERDMKWLVAALLQQEGFPRDYDCHLVCEQGTAVLREGPARALFTLSGGRIKTCYTGIQGGLRLIWEEKGKGNSRGKAPLESLHNYLKNESANLPGQTGVDHERQPATLPAQLRETRDMLTLSTLLSPEDAQRIQYTLLRYDEATARMDAIYRRANERIEHNLEGFARDVIGWRLSPGAAWNWTRELPAGAMGVATLETTTRKPSPVEMKARLKEGVVFLKLPDWAWKDFFEHTQKVARVHDLEFSFKSENREYVFAPTADQFNAAVEIEKKGEKLCGFYNDRSPDRIYLLRADGQFFATWQRKNRLSRDDHEGLKKMRELHAKRAAFVRRGPEYRAGEKQAALLRKTFENQDVLQSAGILPPAVGDTRPGAELSREIAVSTATHAEDRRAVQQQKDLAEAAEAALERCTSATAATKQPAPSAWEDNTEGTIHHDIIPTIAEPQPSSGLYDPFDC